jgi:hypothetical protein
LTASRQHGDCGSPPLARMPSTASAVEFGSGVPKESHSPDGCWASARAASPFFTAGSLDCTCAVASAWSASAVVSGSIAVPVGVPLKFQAPFGCCAARTSSTSAAGPDVPAPTSST